MKFLYLAVAIYLVPGVFARASATDADYVCFMTTNSGEVIDLSTSVCKHKPSSQPVATAPAIDSDQAFITEYKSTLSRFPDVQKQLLTSMETPQVRIEQAKSICNDLKAGLSLTDIKQNQVDAASTKAGVFNVSLVTNLATKYYCPEFSEP